MIDADGWIRDLAGKLEKHFSSRLVFVGLQGSFRRGEAGPESDLDAVVVLDRLDAGDLSAYRAIVDTMPEPERACGFVCGRDELRRWPAHEIFHFAHDTRAYRGSLDGLVPDLSPEDVRQSVRIGAAGLYHQACHLYVHGKPEAWAAGLRGLFKQAFFTLLAVQYLRDGRFAENKRELGNRLEGRELAILSVGMEWDARAREVAERPWEFFDLLLGWSGELLKVF